DRSVPFGLGYSVLCLKGYGDPRLVVLLGVEPAREVPGVEMVRRALLMRNDQFQSDAKNVATRLHYFITRRLFPNLAAELVSSEPGASPSLDRFRTLRDDRASMIRNTRVAATILRYFRNGERWDAELSNRIRAAFALGPWSRYFCPISETLLPPEHWAVVDELLANLSERREPAEDLVAKVTERVPLDDGRDHSSAPLDSLVIGPALKHVRDTSSQKLALLGQTYW
ncbi:MAG: hypothetical protein ACREDR_43840, partial [Blastocatellia bacterium]